MKVKKITRRNLTGVSYLVAKWLSIVMILTAISYLLQIHLFFGLAIFREQYFGLFVGLVLCLTFLHFPFSSTSPRDQVPWYDWVLFVLGLFVGIYVTINYPRFLENVGVTTPERWIPGAIAVILILEASRRTMGWILTGLALFFIFYALFGYVMPGILYTRGISWPALSTYLYLDVNGIFGVPTYVVSTIVLAYILFGTILFKTGGGGTLVDIAIAFFGRFTGGPAKAAVAASSLFGSISGSVSANVVITGSVTIPLMKTTGFKPRIAGAIEAAASTGGQLMPPMMGAAAFVMATFINVPYAKVAIAALVPALLYFLALFIQIDLEARKMGLKSLTQDECPSRASALSESWVFFIPLLCLIYFLFILHWSPAKCALLAGLITLFLSYFRRETRRNFREFLGMLEESGRSMISLGIIGAIAGIVIGGVFSSGVVFSLTMMSTGLGQEMLLPLLIIVAVVCLILGMGLPTTAIYVMVAILVCPILERQGIYIIAAHLFVFYYALLCFVTPPVCFAAFIGAEIAHADMMKTGWSASRLVFAAYFVPFAFVFSPALLLEGSSVFIIVQVIAATMGICLLALAASNYMFRPIGNLKRLLALLGGIGLLFPLERGGWLLVGSLVGAGLGLLMFLFELRWWLANKRKKAMATQLNAQELERKDKSIARYSV